jgi:dTDP-4-dehydrorhamnose reductase
MNKILVLGDGLLGSEIVRQTGWDYISRKKDGIDFEYPFTYTSFIGKYDQILNCVGYTDTYSNNKELHWNINYKGVIDLVFWCNNWGKKIIHISTDYLYSNVSQDKVSEDIVPMHCENWYGYTKLLSDGFIQAKAKNYLLVRTSFKPKPFPYPEAIVQFGNFDYVDVISSLIIQLINKNASGVFNVGTKAKSMLELAKQTNPDIQYRGNLDNTMPVNVTMNIDKMNKFLE